MKKSRFTEKRNLTQWVRQREPTREFSTSRWIQSVEQSEAEQGKRQIEDVESAEIYKVKDLYEVLEIGEEHTKEELHSAYLKALRKWHPDRCPKPELMDRYRQMFVLVKKAYAILSNSQARETYDRYLRFNAIEIKLRDKASRDYDYHISHDYDLKDEEGNLVIDPETGLPRFDIGAFLSDFDQSRSEEDRQAIETMIKDLADRGIDVGGEAIGHERSKQLPSEWADERDRLLPVKMQVYEGGVFRNERFQQLFEHYKELQPVDEREIVPIDEMEGMVMYNGELVAVEDSAVGAAEWSNHGISFSGGGKALDRWGSGWEIDQRVGGSLAGDLGVEARRGAWADLPEGWKFNPDFTTNEREMFQNKKLEASMAKKIEERGALREWLNEVGYIDKESLPRSLLRLLDIEDEALAAMPSLPPTESGVSLPPALSKPLDRHLWGERRREVEEPGEEHLSPFQKLLQVRQEAYQKKRQERVPEAEGPEVQEPEERGPDMKELFERLAEAEAKEQRELREVGALLAQMLRQP